jgi:hypothetical protein
MKLLGGKTARIRADASKSVGMRPYVRADIRVSAQTLGRVRADAPLTSARTSSSSYLPRPPPSVAPRLPCMDGLLRPRGQSSSAQIRRGRAKKKTKKNYFKK